MLEVKYFQCELHLKVKYNKFKRQIGDKCKQLIVNSVCVDTDQECFVANSVLIQTLKKFNQHLKQDIKSFARRACK